MKKSLFILTIVILTVLSSCARIHEDAGSSGEATKNKETEMKNTSESIKETKYGVMNVDYFIWDNVKEMLEETEKINTTVLSGKVTGISFQVLDKKTGKVPTKEEKEKYELEYGHNLDNYDIYELITLYDIDVDATYKGEKAESAKIKMMGGLKDFKEEEQLAELKKYEMDYIVYQEPSYKMDIGETYLFVLGNFDGSIPTPKNPMQCIYNLKNPFEKSFIGQIEENPEDLYSMNKTKYGRTLISAMDIIKVCGEDKWGAFWTQWQKDNPVWESRINKSAVDKALANQ